MKIYKYSCLEKPISKQSGFSIIELLVAMVIATFMVGVAMTYFISSARAYKTQVADGRIQENVRFGLDILTNNLRFAGFCDVDKVDLCREVTKIYTGKKCALGGGVGIDPCTDDVNAITDRLAIDFKSNTPTTACAGAVNVPADTRIFMTFRIDAATRSLICEAFTLDAADAATSLDSVVLVNGIDAMQVQYGIDINGDTDGDGVLDGQPDTIVDSYQNISNIPEDPEADDPTIKNASLIKTVKLILLANSGLSATKDKDLETDQSRTYTLFDESITFAAGDPRSRELKQIFSTTVHLKSK